MLNIFVLGIRVKKDLPVGQKLYDHLIFVGLTYTLNQSVVHNLDEEVNTFLEFILTGNGPLSAIGMIITTLIRNKPFIDDVPV